MYNVVWVNVHVSNYYANVYVVNGATSFPFLSNSVQLNAANVSVILKTGALLQPNVTSAVPSEDTS